MVGNAKPVRIDPTLSPAAMPGFFLPRVLQPGLALGFNMRSFGLRCPVRGKTTCRAMVAVGLVHFVPGTFLAGFLAIFISGDGSLLMGKPDGETIFNAILIIFIEKIFGLNFTHR